MDTQYYDILGNILEIPVLRGDDSADVQAINAEILALKDIWSSYLAEPYEHINRQMIACPTTGRYISLVLLTEPNGSGDDGDVYTWTYDTKQQTRLTAEDALSMAGVAAEDLSSAVRAELSAYSPNSLTMNSFEIAGFRIRTEGAVDFFLQATTEEEALPDGGYLDSFRCLYIWSAGALTRQNFWTAGTLTRHDPTETLGGSDAMDPPLWWEWHANGGEPQGGFTEPPLPKGADRFREELRRLVPELLSLPEDTDLSFAYRGSWEKVNGVDCWSIDVYRTAPHAWSEQNEETKLGCFYQAQEDGAVFTKERSQDNINYYDYFRIVRNEDGRLSLETLPQS